MKSLVVAILWGVLVCVSGEDGFVLQRLFDRKVGDSSKVVSPPQDGFIREFLEHKTKDPYTDGGVDAKFREEYQGYKSRMNNERQHGEVEDAEDFQEVIARLHAQRESEDISRSTLVGEQTTEIMSEKFTTTEELVNTDHNNSREGISKDGEVHSTSYVIITDDGKTKVLNIGDMKRVAALTELPLLGCGPPKKVVDKTRPNDVVLDLAAGGLTSSTTIGKVGLSDDELTNLDAAVGCENVSDAEWGLLNETNYYRWSLKRDLPCLRIQRTALAASKLHGLNYAIQGGISEWCCAHSWIAQPSIALPLNNTNIDYTNGCYSCNDQYPDTTGIMWYKINEIYNSTTLSWYYELAYAQWGFNISDLTPAQILNAYKNSPDHNMVIANTNWWQGYVWRGVGISTMQYSNFLAFVDNEDELGYCKSPEWVFQYNECLTN